MLRFKFSGGVISLALDLRGFASVWRLMAVGAVDLWSYGMHPASPHQPILLRNRLKVPL